MKRDVSVLHIPARERYSQAVVETKQSGSGKVGDDTHNISAKRSAQF